MQNSTISNVSTRASIPTAPNKMKSLNTELPISAENWFAKGNRVPFDRQTKKIISSGMAASAIDVVHVFKRVSNAETRNENSIWTSFLPGWPDGSYGWSRVDSHLEDQNIGPRLFVEYIGHGDSDKPAIHPYSTDERADLVEAMWEAEGIRSTFIAAFDYSVMVSMELLSRQQDRLEQGLEPFTHIVGVLLINGGLFADGHTHPLLTTPALKSPFGGVITVLGQRSRLVFGELMKSVFSKEYAVTSEELDELYVAISRRDGVHSMSRTAGFVDHHKRNSKRLNLKRLFHALSSTVSFHVVGSKRDPFEGHQIALTEQRLGHTSLDIRTIPGGHMATSEQPEKLAEIILDINPNSQNSLT